MNQQKTLTNQQLEPNKEDKFLLKLAREYHIETEAYDQTVCSGRAKDGTAMPLGSNEMVLINRNANKVMALKYDQAQHAGYTRAAFKEVLKQYANSELYVEDMRGLL